jgi:hypothetical protein
MTRSTVVAAFDRAVYNIDNAVTAGISVNLAPGIVTGDARVGTDTLRSVEGVRGTDFADTFDATGFSASSSELRQRHRRRDGHSGGVEARPTAGPQFVLDRKPQYPPPRLREYNHN